MDVNDMTTAQQSAVKERNKDILVSASAGSGKTAVLVERVIGLLQDNPDLNIDSMLLVTFTNEAAKNMRERIRKRLLKSDNPQLRRQVNRVAIANISTIHSFCEQVIKRYYYVIGLDPQYRLLTDDTEQHLLKERIFQNLQEYFFGQESEQQAFVDLSRNFVDAKSNVGEGLADVVEKLYNEANAQPRPEEWLDNLVNNYELPQDGEWTKSHFYVHQLQPILKRRLLQDQADLQTNVDNAPSLDDEKKSKIINDDYQLVDQILKAISDGTTWDELRSLISKDDFQRMSGPKSSEEYQAIKTRRDAVKKDLDDLHKSYFMYSNEQMSKVTKAAQTMVRELVKVTIRYRRDYQDAKLQRHLLDFSDLEHYAYQILTADSDAGKAVRKQLQQHFKEILVDEYQDTNRLQDELLNQLHNPQFNHMFMVGDVKQSIYRFRQADPTLFLEKGQRFAGDEAQNTMIYLADNFRSMQGVVDFTNLIFTQLMDKEVGQMDYDQDAQLKYGAEWYTDADQPATEVMIYDANAADDHQSDDTKKAYVQRPEGPDKLSGEIWMVGMRIRQMLDNGEKIYDLNTHQMRPIKPSDIVLLERNKEANPKIIAQFERLNIPVMVHDSKNFFKATEIRTIVSLLKIIDNPLQDIPLVAVLRSPIVGLNEPEMAFLRIHDRYDDFYHAVQSFVNNKKKLPLKVVTDDVDQIALFNKLFKFLNDLHEYQRIAQQEGLVKLIWHIYQQTGFLDYVGIMQGGAQRQANLHALYKRAKAYENSSFKGLYQFVHFIDWMQKQDEDLGEAPVQWADDAVNVMTIHGSKGLEFPIVFLINSNKGFNNQDVTSNLIINPNQGIGLKLIGQSSLIDSEASDQLTLPTQYDLPQRSIITDSLKRENRAEEMRLLYVALTRAEQRLVITGSVNENNRYGNLKRSWQSWEKALQSDTLALGAQYRLNAKSMLDWIIACLVRTPQFKPSTIDQKFDQDSRYGGQFINTTFTMSLYDANAVDERLASLDSKRGQQKMAAVNDHKLTALERNFIHQVINLNYQHKAAVATTPYQSVSAIRGLFVNQDPDDRSMAKLTYDDGRPKTSGKYIDTDFGQPQFMNTDSRLSAAEIGTATHLVFQKLNVENGQVDINMVRKTISDLRAQKLIASDHLAEAINAEGVANFYATDLGRRILEDPRQLYREHPFSMLMDGKDIFSGLAKTDGPVLIHGIIDGYLVEKDGITLFDYKTDHLRLNDQSGFSRLVKKYAGQVNLYARALVSQTGMPVTKRCLYFVQTGQLYELQGE
ncbi:MAG TPA: helicase-exonuclease AddAB subunit AddA [Candidatus Limosilactobacillus merdigallinarum]|uniref:ATP-dependent helicase/nuclease subunit A n=1 Tax=Candidatus Limosilactobacillus merdigallinarum TaxID=2838652 RepID=A0A9D1VH85_9LACO|nr:helicase-exonuclease AddAB subunit AddA [Candidatus Limosilactobacillus merdigallinarum]